MVKLQCAAAGVFRRLGFPLKSFGCGCTGVRPIFAAACCRAAASDGEFLVNCGRTVGCGLTAFGLLHVFNPHSYPRIGCAPGLAVTNNHPNPVFAAACYD